MKVLGITGGIASGKSIVIAEIGHRGYPAYQADIRAKTLMESVPSLREALGELLGEMAFTSEGQLNRSYIARRLFQEPELRQQINALVHPHTIDDFVRWVEERRAEGYPAAFKEAALTIEAGAYQGLDGLVLVYAPWSVRVERLMKREALSQEAALARLKSQMPEWAKLHHADHVCLNTGRLSIPLLVDTLLVSFSLPLSLNRP